jgi:hypothetical protein
MAKSATGKTDRNGFCVGTAEWRAGIRGSATNLSCFENTGHHANSKHENCESAVNHSAMVTF